MTEHLRGGMGEGNKHKYDLEHVEVGGVGLNVHI